MAGVSAQLQIIKTPEWWVSLLGGKEERKEKNSCPWSWGEEL